MSLHYHLPKGAGYGWGVCGSSLSSELDALGAKEVVIPPFSNEPVALDNGKLIEAVEGISGLPVHKFIWPWRRLGYAFIEDDILFSKYAANLQLYDSFVCGSSYMHDELEASGALSYVKDKTSYAIQGVDSSRFLYDETYTKPPNLKDKYVIGSFGKFEYRKGQDAVIAAFKQVAQTRKDVVLAVNWFNPWPQTIESMKYSPYIGSSKVLENLGTRYAGNWSVLQNTFYENLLFEQGLKRDQFIVLPPMEHSNPAYADMYRMCDLIVFPNRKEAGTNLPLMEALCTGTRCAFTVNHGHSDVYWDCLASSTEERIGTFDIIPSKQFTHETPSGPVGTYYEPDLDSIIVTMSLNIEREYNGFQEHAFKLGEKWTWRNTANRIVNLL